MSSNPPTLNSMCSATLTVIICTYQRNELLEECLLSLQQQTISPDHFEILIVDNAGTEGCKALADKYGAAYILEPNVGLSHARNAGWQFANTPWILYLDDDAKASPDLLSLLLAAIEQAPTAGAIGGRFTHWFKTIPPEWLKLYYPEDGYRPSPQTEAGPLDEGYYLVGCVMAVNTNALRKAGGFDLGLGMKGKRIGWAEEDELQDRLRAAGYPIIYVPKLLIHHLVQPYKYTLKNQLAMAYASGRDRTTLEKMTNNKYTNLLVNLLRIVLLTVPYDIARWLFRKNFYWQNALQSTGTKIAFAAGIYRNKKWAND